MACKSKKGKGKLIALALSIGLCSIFASVKAEETQSPVQEVQVTNSYLTKAHIRTNSKTEIQVIKIEKSFLVWVTLQKAKDQTTTTNNTK